MSAEVLRQCDPWKYYRKFLDKDVYPDGRKIDSFRPIMLQMDTKLSAAGSSLARHGSATVTCAIDPHLGVVSDAPSIYTHIKASATVAQAVVDDASMLVNHLVHQNAFCAKDSLKAVNGRLTWILHLNVMILDTDGAVVDAVVMSIVCALFDLRLPHVVSNFDDDIPIELDKVEVTDEFFRIDVPDIPVSCTFIVYAENGKETKILCDPAAKLFEILPSIVSVTVGNDQRILRILHNGICGSLEIMREIVKIAFRRQKVVADSLRRARVAHLNAKCNKMDHR